MLDILNPSSGRSASRRRKKKKNECTKEEEKWSHPSLYCGAVAMKNNHKEDRWRREERKGGKMERGGEGDVVKR